MMRSLYSGVAGLKTHQTKMDVIGNNIANVNTVAFKGSRVTFNDIMYQTTSSASGPNELTGVGGINAKQIGLGVTMATTTTSITTAGATQTTGSALDCKINGNSFFIVNNGTENVFTRVGSFYFDAIGNLCLSSTGYNVMGWQVDPTNGQIKKDTVSALRIMSEANLVSPPEATTNAIATGIIDANSTAVETEDGYVMNLNFYDALGYQYTAKFKVITDKSGEAGLYDVSLSDILDVNGKSILTGQVTAKDLWGSADTSVKDKGTLLAGRYPARDLIVDGASLPANTTIDPPVDTSTRPNFKLYHYYLTDIDGGTEADNKIEGTDLYVDEQGKYYAKHVETSGTTENITYVPFSNASDTYSFDISKASLEIKKYFKNNFANVDDDLYVDGNSTYTDATVYTDFLVIGGQKFTTAPGWRLKSNDPDSLKTTNPTNLYLENTTTGEHYPMDNSTTPATNATWASVKNMGDVFLDTRYFTTTANKDTIVEVLKPNPPVVTVDVDNDKDNYTDYVVDLVGTKYYTQLRFNTDDGTFASIGSADIATLAMKNLDGKFENVAIDFTTVSMFNNGGTSTMGMESGSIGSTRGAGKKLGAMTGVSINSNGMIYGSYDNGNTVLLGQIAVAKFANASGLEMIGDSCYQTTLNSGSFDGIGVDVSADGGSLTTGALEMSNVDLSAEFTDMITTQRGFQANSRVITTSDTLLEELINLKR